MVRLGRRSHGRSRRWSVPRTAFAWLIAMIFMLPLLTVVNSSLMTEREFNATSGIALARHPTLSVIISVFNEADLGRAIGNSLLAVGVGVAVTVLASSLASFWFLERRGFLRDMAWRGIVTGLLVPGTAYIIPLYVLISAVHLTNNLFVLGFVYAGVWLPFATFLMHNYLRGVPHEIVEASLVDGANPWQQYWRVMLPVSRPMLAAVAGFAGVGMLGDLLFSLILVQNQAAHTMVVAILDLQSRYDANPQQLVAGGLVVIAFSLLVFAVAQRYIQAGITAGAVK